MRSLLSLAPFVFSVELTRGEGAEAAILTQIKRHSPPILPKKERKEHGTFSCMYVMQEENLDLVGRQARCIMGKSAINSKPFQSCPVPLVSKLSNVKDRKVSRCILT